MTADTRQLVHRFRELTIALDGRFSHAVFRCEPFVGFFGVIILITPCQLPAMCLFLSFIPLAPEITGLIGMKVAAA